LQHPGKRKKRYSKVNNVIKKKTTLSKKQRIIKTVNKKNKKKTNKYDEAKSLTSRLKKALNAHRTLKGLRKSVATTNPNKTKSNIISSNSQLKNKQKINLKTQAPVDKKTIEITEMLKKRGIDKNKAKGERFQTYRGSKNTYFKIIYTRM